MGSHQHSLTHGGVEERGWLERLTIVDKLRRYEFDYVM